MALARVVRIRHGALGLRVLRLPLLRASGALGQLPLVPEEVLEEAVVPLRRVVGPGPLKAARDSVRALAGSILVLPAEALVLKAGALRLRTDVPDGGSGAMRLAERVAADDKRNRLLVVHCHASERLADVPGRGLRIGIAAGALGVHVDEAHLDGAERRGELAVAAVALVSQPGVFRAPEDVLWLPDVGPAEAKAERLKPH